MHPLDTRTYAKIAKCFDAIVCVSRLFSPYIRIRIEHIIINTTTREK